MAKIESFFELCSRLEESHINFFNKNGFILFRNFLSAQKIDLCLSEFQRIEKSLIAHEVKKINGVPIKFGQDEQGNKIIRRLCFASQQSNALHLILQDKRLQALKVLLPIESRLGDREKDGLVFNNYYHAPGSNFSQMGWHTDVLRDIFLSHRIMPMLNVGIHLDACAYQNGGLRLLAGTHKQSLPLLLFRKPYFLSKREDKNEVGLDIFPGDLTVHDGRIWHRVQQCPRQGEPSRRRVMYIPLVTGKFRPKSEKSATPLYQWIFDKLG